MADGMWRCRVQINKRRVTGRGPTKEAAIAAMMERMARLSLAPRPPRPRAVRRPRRDARPFVRLADPTFRQWIYERDEGICGICGRPVAFSEMHVDHIRPVSEGGPDVIGNLRISHSACNLRRGWERLQPIYL